MGRSVVKFGGSNFRDSSDIQKILDAVRLYTKPPVLVVSAFYGVTDELDSLVDSLSDSSQGIEHYIDGLGTVKKAVLEKFIDHAEERSRALAKIGKRLDDLGQILQHAQLLGKTCLSVRDRILSYGERLSSLVLTEILNHYNIPALEKLPEHIGLQAAGFGGDGVVDFDASATDVKEGLPTDRVCVVPGFYAIDRNRNVILLGRGGSDYSAAAIARCIGADSLDIWKDVNGYMTADPGTVKNARPVERLGYLEVAELSYFGARILHPRTVEPLEHSGIDARIFNIARVGEHKDSTGTVPEPLSTIGPDSLAPGGLKSVTFSDDFAVLSLLGAGVGIRPGILARVTGALDSSGVNIKSVVTSQTVINLYLDEADLDAAQSVIEELELHSLSDISAQKNLSVVALVGKGQGKTPHTAENMIMALDKAKIPFGIFSVGASDAAAYAVISRSLRSKAVRALHDWFFGS